MKEELLTDCLYWLDKYFEVRVTNFFYSSLEMLTTIILEIETLQDSSILWLKSTITQI